MQNNHNKYARCFQNKGMHILNASHISQSYIYNHLSNSLLFIEEAFYILHDRLRLLLRLKIELIYLFNSI